MGALALYAEFNHPGAIVPGVVGVVFILLALFALNLLPTRYASFTLIIAAFVLFALEAKFATHGILGIGGIALLTLGGFLLVDGPIPQLRVNLLTALAVSVPLGADHRLSDDHCPASAAQQGGHRQARADRRHWRSAHRHRSRRQGLRAGRTMERPRASPVGIGEPIVVRKVEGLELEVEKQH